MHSMVVAHLTLVAIWLKVVSICSDHRWEHMCPVVSQEDGVEELSEFPSALLISWGIIGVLCFCLGAVCSACCRSKAGLATTAPGRWERLVRRALHFVNRRRRVALAFNAYKGSSLRNTEGSRPNQARRTAKARAQTPTPGRVLNEGPAIRQRHGPH